MTSGSDDRTGLMTSLRSALDPNRVKFGVNGKGKVTDPGRIYLDGERFICVKPRESRPYVQFWRPGGPEFENKEGLRPPKPGEHVGFVEIEYHGDDFGRARRLCLSAFANVDPGLVIAGHRPPQPVTTPTLPPKSAVGQPYVDKDERVATARAEPWATDPDAVDRGLAAHRRLQNLIAAHLRASGLTPVDPRPGDPQFDVGWEAEGGVGIVEVKSLTEANEEAQLRLGLGQLLRYRQQMRRGDWEVRAFLAVERQQQDVSWAALCEEVGVVLVWPAVLEALVR